MLQTTANSFISHCAKVVDTTSTTNLKRSSWQTLEAWVRNTTRIAALACVSPPSCCLSWSRASAPSCLTPASSLQPEPQVESIAKWSPLFGDLKLVCEPHALTVANGPRLICSVFSLLTGVEKLVQLDLFTHLRLVFNSSKQDILVYFSYFAISFTKVNVMKKV